MVEPWTSCFPICRCNWQTCAQDLIHQWFGKGNQPLGLHCLNADKWRTSSDDAKQPLPQTCRFWYSHSRWRHLQWRSAQPGRSWDPEAFRMAEISEIIHKWQEGTFFWSDLWLSCWRMLKDSSRVCTSCGPFFIGSSSRMLNSLASTWLNHPLGKTRQSQGFVWIQLNVLNSQELSKGGGFPACTAFAIRDTSSLKAFADPSQVALPIQTPRCFSLSPPSSPSNHCWPATASWTRQATKARSDLKKPPAPTGL